MAPCPSRLPSLAMPAFVPDATLWSDSHAHAGTSSSLFVRPRPCRTPGIVALVGGRQIREGARPLAAVVCHPHPLFGGTMHNKVVYQTAKTLHRFGLPVLRFNFRGVGSSEGSHDQGEGEREDVSAALDFLAGEYPGAPLLLAGFSFGSWVGLRVGCRDARVTHLIGLGLPVERPGRRPRIFLSGCVRETKAAGRRRIRPVRPAAQTKRPGRAISRPK